MPRPRVFVSSVVEGFERERDAARRGILAAGCVPVLVNEDFPSLAVSSRNACLDAVGSCDAVLLIVGGRGGWVAPSGRLVVEEEYLHARQLGLPVLVFLAEVERDPEAARLARALSDYVDGHFRQTFRDVAALAVRVEESVRALASQLEVPMADMVEVRSLAAEDSAIRDACSVRLVVGPERREELLDPARLQSVGFRDVLYRLGHDEGVKLLDYERPKASRLDGGFLVVVQSDQRGRAEGVDEVVVRVGESGIVIVESNVSGWVSRDADGSGLLGDFVLAFEDVVARLEQAFRFVAALFEELDPYRRHTRFAYQVGVLGIGYRRLERNPQPRRSFTPRNVFGVDRPVVLPAESRVVSREVLLSPAAEIQRVMALLERELAE